MYIFPFSLFVSVYMYASLCEFVCIALLLPFVLRFSLSSIRCFFFSIVVSACYHWWICVFLVWLLSSFFFSYFLIFLFSIIIFYFNDFLFFSFFLSFFLPFLLSRVDDRVLVLWPGVRPVLLRWESQVQDIGPQETSQLHIKSNGKSSPRDLHLSVKTQLHSTTSKLQCWTPYAKQLARQEHKHTHLQRGCLKL